MNRRLELFSIVLFALDAGMVGGGVTSALADEAEVEVGIGELRGEILSLFAPPGAVATETNPNYKGAAAPAPAAPPSPAAADWPSYNKTLTSERFSDLSQINTKNVGKLKVLMYLRHLAIDGLRDGPDHGGGRAHRHDRIRYLLDRPATCAENWRTHEEYPAYILPTNRGAAYLDGMLFRGTQDGRVLAYDFKTGKRLWETTIADVKKGEDVPAAPIAWEGLVFIGNAGGDFKGGKGHMYALDAKTGKIVWEFFLVPKTEGDAVRGPAGRLAARQFDLEKRAWRPISGGGTWTSATLDPATGSCMCPLAIPRPTTTTRAARARISSPTRWSSSTPRPALTRTIIQIVPRDWHDWDVSNPPALYQDDGGQEIDGGVAEGRTPLRTSILPTTSSCTGRR